MHFLGDPPLNLTPRLNARLGLTPSGSSRSSWGRLVAIVVSAAILSLAAGCSLFHHKKDDYMASPEVAYERANKLLKDGSYMGAIRTYETLTARFPFSDPARQSRLDLIYAYYRQGEKESAVDAADSFIRENPTHPRIDYAYYMKGLIYFERSRNFLERWFDVDLAKRPPQDARKSFDAFARVVSQYPHSDYAPESRQRMIHIRNRLAEYEVNVGRYYIKRGAYVAALARARYEIENYDGAPATKAALAMTVECYQKLGINDLAEDTAKVLAGNFANDTVASQTQVHRWWHFWSKNR